MKVLLRLMSHLGVNVGDFAVSDTANCPFQAAEGSSIREANQNESISAQDASINTPVLDPSYINTSIRTESLHAFPLDLDSMLTDFDMDEIMKSFDFSPDAFTQDRQATAQDGWPQLDNDFVPIPDSLVGHGLFAD